MVIISEDIQIQLKSLVEQYVDYRTKGEYGISAFWYWYYQVMNYLRCMDNAKIRSGFNKVYRMPKWGTVVYTKIVIGKEVIVYADTFKYSKRNLYDWLNHKSNKRPSYSVCDTCFGFNSVLYDNSQKYGILKPDGKPLVKPIFDDIINFHHSSDDYNTLHAIGFINDRIYEITTDGDVNLLHMSKDDYLNAIHKFFEAKQKCKIIEYKQYNTMKNTRNKVRLTESQLHQVIKETLKRVLKESQEDLGSYQISNGYGNSDIFKATYEEAISKCLQSVNAMCTCWLYEVGKGEIGRTHKVNWGDGYVFITNDGKRYWRIPNGQIKEI